MTNQIDTSDTPLMPGGDLTGNQMKDHIGKGAANLLIVDAYAHALDRLDIHPPSSPPPDWYPVLSEKLESAKQHSKNWLNVSAEIGATIPSTIIEYSSEFKAAAGLIESAIKKIQTDGLKPGSAEYEQQIRKISKLLGALKQKLAEIDSNIIIVGKKLARAQKDAAADFTALSNGIGSIQQAEASLSELIDDINIDIETLHQKIDVENAAFTASAIGLGVGLFMLIAGIALTVATGGAGAPILVAIGGGILTIGGAAGMIATKELIREQTKKIAEKTKDLRDDQRQIVVLQGLYSTIKALENQNISAQSAMSTIRTQWAVISDTLDDIISKVNATMTEPDADPIHVILNPLFLQAAVNEWGVLVKLITAFQDARPDPQQDTIRPDAA